MKTCGCGRTHARRDFDRGALMKSIDKDQRIAARRKVQDLKARIADAVRTLKRSLPEGRSFCRQERREASERVKALREKMRREATRLAELERSAARSRCTLTREEARALREQIGALRHDLKTERSFQSEMRRIAAGNRARKARPGIASARVRASESDDEVRSNIGEELVPLFNRVRRGIKGSARESRTEAFLRYVEEHPREVYAGIEDKTDELVRSLERQQRAGRRDRLKPRGARRAARARRRTKRRTRR